MIVENLRAQSQCLERELQMRKRVRMASGTRRRGRRARIVDAIQHNGGAARRRWRRWRASCSLFQFEPGYIPGGDGARERDASSVGRGPSEDSDAAGNGIFSAEGESRGDV